MVAYTYVMLALWALGTYTGSDDVLAVWYATACGVYAAFTAAPVLDGTVYQRLRAKRGWSTGVFYGGHMALHVLPLLGALLCYPPPCLRHGAVAVVAQLSWYATNDLNDLYVRMKKPEWDTLVLLACSCEILCCAGPA